MNRPVLVLSLAAAAGFSIPTAARQAQPRTVYISVVDSRGMPLPELRADDLVVTEEGRARQVVSLERATTPATLALIVDEHQLWSGSVRASLTALASGMPRDWQIGLFSAERPEFTIVDFTPDPKVLLRAIEAFTPVTLQHHSRLVELEALMQNLTAHFRRKNVARPVILAMGPQPRSVGFGFGPRSNSNWDLVIGAVQRSRIAVFAATTTELGLLISTGVEATGGRAEVVLTEVGMPTAVTRILDDIVGQFALTYISPTPPRNGAQLRVRVNRPDADVRAPTRVF